MQGLAYLLTFLFAANTVGLTGLALQLALFPDADLERPPTAPKPGADLPKVLIPMSSSLYIGFLGFFVCPDADL